MVELAESAIQITGDIGGVGISRFRWQRQDATTPLVADCNSALAALHTMYNVFKTGIPNAITITFEGEHKLFDVATAEIQDILVATTVPAAIVGTGGVDYGGGLGARLNWKTTSLHGRRFLRSATFVVPLSNNAYTSQGAVDPTTASTMAAAGQAYIAALNTAGLEPIAWHRPPKGTTTGGAAGLITVATVPTTPAGLRSRRS